MTITFFIILFYVFYTHRTLSSTSGYPKIVSECGDVCHVGEQDNLDIIFRTTQYVIGNVLYLPSFETLGKNELVYTTIEPSDLFARAYFSYFPSLSERRVYRNIQAYQFYRLDLETYPDSMDQDLLFVTGRSGFTVFNISSYFTSNPTEPTIVNGFSLDSEVVGKKSIFGPGTGKHKGDPDYSGYGEFHVPVALLRTEREYSTVYRRMVTRFTRVYYFDQYSNVLKMCRFHLFTHDSPSSTLFSDCEEGASNVKVLDMDEYSVDSTSTFSDLVFADAEYEYIYFLEQNRGTTGNIDRFHIINVKDEQPVYKKAKTTSYGHYDINFLQVDLARKLLFIGTDHGLDVYDVTNPLEPEFKTAFFLTDSHLNILKDNHFSGMVLDDDGTAYIAHYYGFLIANIRCSFKGDPTYPCFGSVQLPVIGRCCNESDLAVPMDILGVVGGEVIGVNFMGHLGVINVTDKTNPFLRIVEKEAALGSAYKDLGSDSGFTIMGFGDAGFGVLSKGVIQMLDDGAVEYLSLNKFGSKTASFTMDGEGYAYVIDEGFSEEIRFLKIMKISSQATHDLEKYQNHHYLPPEYVNKGPFMGAQYFEDLAVTVSEGKKDYLYIAAGEKGLLIVDISVKGVYGSMGIIDFPLNNETFGKNKTQIAFRVFVRGNYAYVSLHESSTKIVDVSDHLNPVVVGVLDVLNMKLDPVFDGKGSCAYGAIYVDENDLAYVCSCGYHGDLSISELKVFNVSDKKHPKFLFQTEQKIGEMFVGCNDVVARGNLIFMASGGDGFRILEKTDDGVTLSGSFDMLNAEYVDVDEKGEFARVSGRWDGLVNFIILEEEKDVESESKGQKKTVYTPVPKGGVTGDIRRVRHFYSEDNIVYVASDEGISVLSHDINVYGRKSFKYSCQDSGFTLVAADKMGSVTTRYYPVKKESYCDLDYSTCNRNNYTCICKDYRITGDLCEEWSCNNFSHTSPQVCNGAGKCGWPEECICTSYFWSGEYCETNMIQDGILWPMIGFISIFGIEMLVLLVFGLICCACLLVCCACSLTACIAGIVLCCVCCVACCLVTVIGTVAIRLIKSVSKYRKLKNFDLHLKEQLLEEDETVAHLKFNKQLFEIDYKDIESIGILGEGGSNSMVFKVKWRGEICAFKCFKTRTLAAKEDTFFEFERELELLSSLAHPNIIRFFGACLHPPRVGILMEFCPNGELLEFIVDYRKSGGVGYPFFEKILLLTGVASALEFLHSKNVIHRDLKCENVLISRDHKSKLMDFGLSRLVEDMSDGKTKRVGTSVYMAPEIVAYSEDVNYTEKVDVFSFAIMLYVCLTETETPYGADNFQIELKVANDPNYRPKLNKLDDSKVIEEEEEVEWVKEMCRKCWDVDPNVRYSCGEIRKMMEEKREKFLEREKKNEKNEEKASLLDSSQSQE